MCVVKDAPRGVEAYSSVAGETYIHILHSDLILPWGGWLRAEMVMDGCDQVDEAMGFIVDK